jgi:hypothetical protein
MSVANSQTPYPPAEDSKGARTYRGMIRRGPQTHLPPIVLLESPEGAWGGRKGNQPIGFDEQPCTRIAREDHERSHHPQAVTDFDVIPAKADPDLSLNCPMSYLDSVRSTNSRLK